MKSKIIFFGTTLLLLLAPLLLSQSKETGAIVGTITDEENTPLPGVTVTLTSPALMGARTFMTDSKGAYRFPALPPGEYTVKADLQGFASAARSEIRLTTTTRLTVDLVMRVTALEEEVTVVAKSPTVDVKSTETVSVTLSDEILRNIPYSQFTSSIVNMAPGVTPENMADSAYGAQSGTGIAYSMDGVNVADPEGGTAWVFLDHNIIEAAKVMGIGLPAEYGNFTGVIFNIVTKSGGNEFSGHFEADFQGEKEDWPSGFWQQDNNKEFIDEFPDVTSPRYKFYDLNAHVGGPIKRDKLWFYTGVQFQHFDDYATGFPEPRAYDQPRWFAKITWQLSPSTNIMFSSELDSYDGINRYASATTALEATINQKSPEWVGNFSLTHILSPTTFFDVKVAYFWGYYYLEPKVGREEYARFDSRINKLRYSAGYYYLADRTRFQANASLTHYVEDFIQGAHDFKFGVEFENSTVRSQFGYPGYGGPLGDNIYYWDYWEYGYEGNYLAYQYEGYDFNDRYTRMEAFVQDSWQITPRINIGAGVRFSQNWGYNRDLKETVWNSGRIAPRIGFTFDLFGDKSTVFKVHWGQFTEGMFSAYFDRLSPKWSDYISYYWDQYDQEWYEFDRITQNWQLQENIKHPYLSQLTISIERELFKDASISFAYIQRDWKNIIGVYDLDSTYEPYDYFHRYNNTSYGIYERTSTTQLFQIENIVPGTNRPYYGDEAYRSYRGFEVLFNKRFSNKWQLLLSYVYSRTKGTIDNGWGDDIGWNSRNSQDAGDPNFWINADGYATYDPTHMLKIQGTYVLPWGIYLNGFWSTVTGTTWTSRVRSSSLSQGRVTFYTEPRGSNHFDTMNSLDLRLEKTFTIAEKYRLGILIDCFNVFNTNAIANWGTRFGYDWYDPSDEDYTPSTDGHDLYRIVTPRQFRLGIRFMF